MRTTPPPPPITARCLRWLAAFALALVPGTTPAADAVPQAATKPAEPDFVAMSLEDLGAIKVTSVSKKAEPLNGVAAAVSVITGDDIRRSGALTLPEALRLAPGVQVASANSHQSAVSVRGFNDIFSQKLLVLMDGRSIYTPLFAGTFWQAQSPLLEDVDRIEVIRGPGGSVWGANAVNGVINIVSKPARETQGVLLLGGGGTDPIALAGVRYGAQLGTNVFFRVYGKYNDWNHSQLVTGGAANDAWWQSQAGFRLDWEPTGADQFTVQGDLFGLQANTQVPQIVLPVFGQPPPPSGYNYVQNTHFNQQGGNLLGRWTHAFSAESDFSAQVYYDRGHFDFPLATETRDTYDLDLRHRFQWGERQEIVWGGGYRLSDSRLTDSTELTLSRKSRSDQVFNVFGQDEIQLVPDRLRLTLGTKLEHNDYTGLEFEPGTRLAWTPTEKQTVWASIARAVRTPSQIESDGTFNLAVLPANPRASPFPTLVSVLGNSDYGSETLIAYELGYRIQAHRRLTLDVVGFVNDYEGLRSASQRVNTAPAPNYIQMQSVMDNRAKGMTYGGEFVTTWQPEDWWRLQGQLSLLQSDLETPPNLLTGERRPLVGFASPEYQVLVRSSMELGRHVDFDLALRYVSELDSAGARIPGQPMSGSAIPGYVTFDVRLAWRPVRNFEISVVGQNLAGSHREFNPTFMSSQYTEITPSAYVKLTFKF